MTKLQRRVAMTAVWTLASTAAGCLILTLMSGGLTVGQVGALFGGVVARDGLFVFAVAALGAVCGAIIGDMPGLRRTYAVDYLRWYQEQRERMHFSIVRESMALVVGWLLLCLALQALSPVSYGLCALLSAFGAARVIQLGRDLHLRKRYRRSGTATTGL